MLILAIDTTGNVCSVALGDGKKIIAEAWLNHKKTHSEGLMPMVDFVLRSAETDITDVGLFACVTGPGSFTGIRIGVSAVKAFAQAGAKPCAAVNTLDSLCANVGCFEGLICPILDARRQEVYNALYDGSVNRQVSQYRALPLAALLEELAGKKTLFLGDGVLAYQEDIKRQMGGAAYFAEENNLLQRASSACLLAYEAAQAKKLLTAFEIEPFYIRKPQAERNYEHSV